LKIIQDSKKIMEKKMCENPKRNPRRGKAVKRNGKEFFPDEEDFFRQMADNLDVGIVFQNQRGSIEYINDKFLEMFGYSRAEVLGRPLDAFLGSGLLRKNSRPESNKKCGSCISLELAWKRKDGTKFFSIFSPRPIFDKRGRFRGNVAAMTDITERRKTEVRLMQSQEELSNLSQYIQSVREKESERIAGEIHDELGQYMTALSMDLNWISNHMDSGDEHRERIIAKIEDMSYLLDKTIHAVQKISSELRPGLLDDLGLIPALEWLIQDFQNRTGIDCALQIQCRHLEFNPEFATAIFRITQEGLNNVARHSQATQVNIIFMKQGRNLELCIEDNGRGISENEIASPLSIGIIGMRVRLRPFDGRLDITRTSGAGTLLRISVPVSEAVGHD